MDAKTKKKTIYGNICIGPCFPAEYLTIHPITNNIVTEKHNFCHIEPYKNRETGNLIEVEECGNADIIYPSNSNYLSIDTKSFLSLIYNINTMFDAIEEIKKTKNKHKIKRMRDNALLSFGRDKDNLPNSFFEYYTSLLINKWLPSYLKQTEQSDIVTKKVDNLTIKLYCLTTDNYTIINKEMVKRLIISYINADLDVWFRQRSHHIRIKEGILGVMQSYIKTLREVQDK